jgi:hypothetical protein
MPHLTNVDYVINRIIPPFKPKSRVVEFAMVKVDPKHVRKKNIL